MTDPSDKDKVKAAAAEMAKLAKAKMVDMTAREREQFMDLFGFELVGFDDSLRVTSDAVTAPAPPIADVDPAEDDRVETANEATAKANESALWVDRLHTALHSARWLLPIYSDEAFLHEFVAVELAKLHVYATARDIEIAKMNAVAVVKRRAASEVAHRAAATEGDLSNALDAYATDLEQAKKARSAATGFGGPLGLMALAGVSALASTWLAGVVGKQATK